MKTDLVIQPASQVGLILINLLQSQAPFFDKVWIVSAFANRPGVRHLAPRIIQAKSRGANVQVIVGIDHQGTSVEVLQELKSLAVSAKIVHNTRPGHTFHPKIYLLEATGVKAELWQKNNLPASSVQRQPGNPTGGLRLVQAGWESKGKVTTQPAILRLRVRAMRGGALGGMRLSSNSPCFLSRSPTCSIQPRRK